MTEITAFGKGILYFVLGACFILLGVFVSALWRPHHPNPLKNSHYECGEAPIGNAWTQANIRFYVMSLIFLIFDVELILILPWTYSFFDIEIQKNNPAWNFLSLTEILFFVAILMVGWVYLLLHEDLDWVKPKPLAPKSLNVVPIELYEQFNRQEDSHRAD